MRRTAALVLLLAALPACAGPTDVLIGEDETARTVEVAAGEELRVGVAENASVGWTWKVTGEPEAGVLGFVERTYDADSPGSTGGGGTAWFRYRAVGPGETQVELSRDFRGEGIDRVVQVTVRVTP